MTLLLGGARSGKSDLAQRLIGSSKGPVSVVVTGEIGDDEMAERIKRHRRDRPEGWITVEAPRDLVAAVAAVPPEHALLLDCLSFWVANLVMDGLLEKTIEARTRELGSLLAARSSPVVVVSNEVGLGIVPGDPLSRRFRDVTGRVHRTFAELSDRSFLVVAGQVLPLTRPEDAFGF